MPNHFVMTRRIFFSIAAALVIVLFPIQELSAKSGKLTNKSATTREQLIQAQAAAVANRTPEQLRADMDVFYGELEATIGYLSGYAIGRDSFQKMGFDGGLQDVMSSLAASRKQFQAMSDMDIRAINNSIPDSATMKKVSAGLHKMRFDADFSAALERTEQWFDSNKNGSSNVTSAPSAPSYIKPVCHFDNLLNYPSAKDLTIAKAFAFAAEIIFLLVPAEVVIPIVGAQAPNPVRIALAIAWGVLEAISLGLDQARSEGVYCQTLALNIQGAMTNDAKFNVSILLPRDAGGFADFLKEMVTAAIQTASSNNISVQCANTRLNEANAFYDQGKWADAYKKYRSAYQNIGSSSCL